MPYWTRCTIPGSVRSLPNVARRAPLTAPLAATRARLIGELRARGLIAPDADAGLPLEEAAAASADHADRQIAEP